jgi:hypothetical protein
MMFGLMANKAKKMIKNNQGHIFRQIEARTTNIGLVKVAVQRSADTFVDNET